MKKAILVALLVASFGAHAAMYDCQYTAPNGFVVKGNQLISVFSNDVSGVLYFGDKAYPFQSINEAADGAYSTDGSASLSVTRADDKGYELNVIYKDAEKTQNFTCSVSQETLDADKREQAEANKTPEQKKAEAKDKAQAAAVAAAKAKAAAEAKATAEARAAKDKANVDSLLDDLNTGKNAPKQPQATNTGASGADINQYSNQIQHEIGSLINTTKYKGKQCDIRLNMDRQGYVRSTAIEGGDADLCADVQKILSISDLPKPPNEAIYNIFKNARLNLRF